MSSAFASGASWSWPGEDTVKTPPKGSSIPGAFDFDEPVSSTPPPQPERPPAGSPPQENGRPRRHYGPRTCRICLEVVLPTFDPGDDSIPEMLNTGPRVSYESADPALGRLFRPCKCKGSQKYVHEGCLQAWRHSDPSYSQRTYWECPTCKFRYRLERMRWSRWISSAAAQVGLTLLIFLITIFLLGFVADPILNFYLDIEDIQFADEPSTWSEHLMKGVASLGVIGLLKVVLLSPWQWWNLRNSGLVGGRRGNTGRNRLEAVTWSLVVIGVVTFLWNVWKGVRSWTRRFLKSAGDRVADVHGDDDGDDDD